MPKRSVALGALEGFELALIHKLERTDSITRSAISCLAHILRTRWPGDTSEVAIDRTPDEADNRQREALRLMLLRWREGTQVSMRWSFRHQQGLE